MDPRPAAHDRLEHDEVEQLAVEHLLQADGLSSAGVLQIHRILSRALKVAVQN